MDVAIQAVGGLAAIAVIIMAVVAVLHLKHKESLTLWLGYVAICLTLLAFALYWQKGIKGRAANPAGRPRVTVVEVVLQNMTPDAHPYFAVLYENSSLTAPALTSTASAFITFSPTQLPENPEYPILTTAPSVIDIGPKGRRQIRKMANFTLSASDIEAIKSGKAWLYVYGFVDYKDEVGRAYKTKFCVVYSPEIDTMSFCNQHNAAQ